MIKCIIVDDEPIARDLLTFYCNQTPELELLTTCRNAQEAYKALHAHEVDLVFLDIQMPLISGTDFLRSLRKPPLVVFTTAYSQYAVEGFELSSVDYLVKPVTFERFYHAVQKVSERIAVHTGKAATVPFGHLFVKQDSKFVRVNHATIRYIQAERDFCSIYTDDKRLFVSMHLKLIAAELPKQLFLRVHRSFIVNVNEISEIKGNTLIVHGLEIPIGANYRTALFQRLRLKA